MNVHNSIIIEYDTINYGLPAVAVGIIIVGNKNIGRLLAQGKLNSQYRQVDSIIAQRFSFDI